MSQAFPKKKFAPGSLSRPRTARTVLLRMAADEARAQRIRDTYEQRKADDPRNTWKALADHVGTSERAVQDWAKTGGLKWENAEKAAAFWEVDFDWLWRGPMEDRQTPDPFLTQSQNNDAASLDERLARIEQALAEASEEREAIMGLLAQQETILDKLTELLAHFPDDEAVHVLTDLVRDQLAAAADAEEALAADSAARAATGRRPRGR